MAAMDSTEQNIVGVAPLATHADPTVRRGHRMGDCPFPGHQAEAITNPVLGAGTGEDVIVAFGHAARVALSEKLPPGSKPSVPIDAAVVAIVDRVEIPR